MEFYLINMTIINNLAQWSKTVQLILTWLPANICMSEYLACMPEDKFHEPTRWFDGAIYICDLKWH